MFHLGFFFFFIESHAHRENRPSDNYFILEYQFIVLFECTNAKQRTLYCTQNTSEPNLTNKH